MHTSHTPTVIRALSSIREAEYVSPRGDSLALLDRSKDLIFSLATRDSDTIGFETDEFGSSTLHHLASLNGEFYAELLKKFCMKYPEAVNQQNKELDTPLHEACRSKNLQAVRILLDYKASCTIFGLDGRTPLMVASIWLKAARSKEQFHRASEIVTLLTHCSVLEGFDFKQKDCHSMSMADLCSDFQNTVGKTVIRGLEPLKVWTESTKDILRQHPKCPRELAVIILEYALGPYVVNLLKPLKANKI
mmetsp:Transcript_24812/g.34576  ORF Transcript_24812/g.34576 Transcript_24812/m.34576 type:complete len:248 (+) Transcript_24812:72-815(+)